MKLYEELIAVQDERAAASLPAPQIIYLPRREFDALGEELGNLPLVENIALWRGLTPHAKPGDIQLAGQAYGRALA